VQDRSLGGSAAGSSWLTEGRQTQTVAMSMISDNTAEGLQHPRRAAQSGPQNAFDDNHIGATFKLAAEELTAQGNGDMRCSRPRFQSSAPRPEA
jgi:hypothetical protein